MIINPETEATQIRCATCGASLFPYELFVARLRGLDKPICLGCAVELVVFMKKQLMPMLKLALCFLPDKGENVSH